MRQRAMVMLRFFAGFAVFLIAGIFLISNSNLQVLGFISLALSFLMIVAVVVYTISGSIQPAWSKRVLQEGREAKATVIENNAVKGIGGYQGSDVWLKLPVKVQPSDEPAFEAQMTCRLTQTLMLKAGGEVTVRYDPSDRSKVVLVGNAMTDLMTKHLK